MPTGLSTFRQWSTLARLALLAWTILLGVVCMRCLIWPRVHSVYPIYSKAGDDWAQGNSLYFASGTDQKTTYRYSPFVAILHLPLYALPEGLGGAAERLLTTLVFLLGCHWWLAAGVPHVLSDKQKGLIFLLGVPLTIGTVNNGQLNLLVMGLLLAAATATVKSRWWLAGACIALATGTKIYPLAVGLLLVVLSPRKLTLPLLVCLAAVIGLPFLCQSPSYVLAQYADWYRVLVQDDRKFLPPGAMYRDLWLMFRDLQIPITAHAYAVVQLATAAGCGALCFLAKKRGWSAPALATLALNLGTCWMMLCGPATEPCTYAMLAPVLVYLAIVAIRPEAWPGMLRYLPATACVLHLALTLTGLFPGSGLKTRLVLPGATLLLAVAYVAAVLNDLRRQGRALVRDAGGNRTHFYRVAAGRLAFWLQRLGGNSRGGS
jgi:hypothetical protein